MFYYWIRQRGLKDISQLTVKVIHSVTGYAFIFVFVAPCFSNYLWFLGAKAENTPLQTLFYCNLLGWKIFR